MTLNYANFCDGTTYNPFDQVTCKSFFFTNVATITSTFTGTLSALSSLAILYAIVRSEQHFGSVYHRIMTSVAFFDFISSTAIALTTIPMPKDVLYPFQGRRVYGTVGTCETQGFAVVFGFLGSFFMFSGLMVYYVSVIQFKISDRKLKRYLEPSIQGFAWVFSLLTSVSSNLINCPHYSYCTFGPYCPYVWWYSTGTSRQPVWYQYCWLYWYSHQNQFQQQQAVFFIEYHWRFFCSKTRTKLRTKLTLKKKDSIAIFNYHDSSYSFLFSTLFSSCSNTHTAAHVI